MKQKTYLTSTRLFVALFSLCGLLIIQTQAASGDLDLSFGNGGKVVAQFDSSWASANATIVQPDGKIVAVGSKSIGRVGGLLISNFALVRYNTDGSLDATFGTGGKVVTAASNGSNGAYAAAIQSDGKIIAAGYSISSNYALDAFTLVRYNTDGSLDTSFGTGGIVLTPITNYGNAVRAVAIQSDGKIVAAGYVGVGWDYDTNIALVRYNTNGSLDTSFGTGGKIVDLQGVSFDAAYAVVIQSDGKIVAAGVRYYNYYGENNGFTLTRYNTNGSPDTSFGTGGRVVTPIGSNATAYAAAIQPDGKIVAVGNYYTGDYPNSINYFALARYNTNGSLDASFGTNGVVVTLFGSTSDSPHAATIQSNGKIVVAGIDKIGSKEVFALARYNTDGTLDASFGSGGKVKTQFSYNSEDAAYAVAIQPDGRIVAAGYSNSGTYSDFAVVRYLGDSISTRRTQFDFDGDGIADIAVFRPSNGAWYLNRSQAGFSGVQFGLSTDKLAPADYDGDGRTDIAVYRDGTWYLLRSTAGFLAVQFGLPNDIPQPADFNGDGKSELAVYRSGSWYTLNLQNNQFNAVQFGLSTDKPVVGDYDGDGRADYAVYRDGTWYLLRSTQGFAAIQFGISTDKLVPADYDGDGKTDQAVYRDGTWYLLRSNAGFAGFQFGLPTDVPAPADYDGDGKSDAAVYRDGNWYLRQSTNGFAAVQFGLANDKPIPTAYLP